MKIPPFVLIQEESGQKQILIGKSYHTDRFSLAVREI